MYTLKVADDLKTIPQNYFKPADKPGRLIELQYGSYESLSYQNKNHQIKKRAIVYIPADYPKDGPYNVLFLMHGEWGDETLYLGVPHHESDFKNVVDNAIENNVMKKMIIVCPTYNNLSNQDSSDEDLSLKLTDNYYQELLYDLMPALSRHFDTFSENDSQEALVKSRDHHAFMGFAMGGVASWRVFQHALSYFHYFFSFSGAINENGKWLSEKVKEQNMTEKDFFISVMTGSEDFAIQECTQQVSSLAQLGETFKFSNDSNKGNLYFYVKPGFKHTYLAAITYFYNGMCQLWRN